MEEFKPHFGGLGDLVALAMLIIAGVIIGCTAASYGIYNYIQAGGVDQDQAVVTAP